MPKVLICASTSTHINNFHLPYLEFFKSRGFEVHVAVPGHEPIKNANFLHSLPITKSFVSFKNVKAVLALRHVIKRTGFDLIITHTALASAVCRLAIMLAGKGKTKVINTVHGYLFWNGCRPIKKLAYLIPEKILRRVTDCIITMNEEDTVTADRLVKKGGQIIKVPGMGVDAARFHPVSETEKQGARQALSLPEDAFVMVYVAEFSKRKNHIELIKAMRMIADKYPQVILLLCGNGVMQDDIQNAALQLGLQNNMSFLGWCSRTEDIYRACDLAVSTSISEGMPFNIIEAQLCALPVVASKIRGHIDLIEHDISGWCYTPGDPGALAEAVISVIECPDRGKKQGITASISAKKYTLPEAFRENTDAYMKVLQADNR